MKKVSIIIPVYNVERYLVECLDSIVNQTYRDLEIVLVNDGSTDRSAFICEKYAKEDSRIIVVHQENSGAANAKNAGLDKATGDYITFADSDDYVESNWIEIMMQAAETYQADIVECDFNKVYKTHTTEAVNHYMEGAKEFTAEEYLKQYLSNWTCSLFWNKLFYRGLLKGIRFRKERRCIDDEFFTYKAVTGARKVVRIQDVLYHYRQRASSAVSTAKNRLQIADDSLEILLERYQWIKHHYPKLRNIYLTHDVEIMFYFAREFEFANETKGKFRSIARSYLKECVFTRASLLTFRYALRLQRVHLKDRDSDMVKNEANGSFEEYFP